jgi:aspartokinase
MQVFKFGGASVKSAEAVRNMAQILKLQKEKILYCCFCNGQNYKCS